MRAFAQPGIRVEALNTVAGNVSLRQTMANACTILDVLGQDVPIYAGCDRPLVLRNEHAAHVHGHDGLTVALLLDPTIVQEAEEHHVAVEPGGQIHSGSNDR